MCVASGDTVKHLLTLSIFNMTLLNHMTKSRSKSFQTKFWNLTLLNTFIHATHPPSSKNFLVILHDASCRDLDFSNDEGVHHISMRARHDNMVDERANRSFARQLFAHQCCHQFSCVVTLWRSYPYWWCALLHPPHVCSLPPLLITSI